MIDKIIEFNFIFSSHATYRTFPKEKAYAVSLPEQEHINEQNTLQGGRIISSCLYYKPYGLLSFSICCKEWSITLVPVIKVYYGGWCCSGVG